MVKKLFNAREREARVWELDNLQGVQMGMCFAKANDCV